MLIEDLSKKMQTLFNEVKLIDLLGNQELAVVRLFDFSVDVILFAEQYNCYQTLLNQYFNNELWWQKAYDETFRNEQILNRIAKEMLETMTSEGYSDDMSLVRFCQIKRDLREGKIRDKWIWDNLLDNEKDDFCIDLEIALDSTLDFIKQRVSSKLTHIKLEKFESELNELQVKLSKINSNIL